MPQEKVLRDTEQPVVAEVAGKTFGAIGGAAEDVSGNFTPLFVDGASNPLMVDGTSNPKMVSS